MENVENTLKFYKEFKLDAGVFSTFSAEHELKKYQAKQLLVPISNYTAVLSNAQSGASIIIAGQRGTGKTLLLNQLKQFLPKETIYCFIDDFTDLKKDFQENDLYSFLISQLSNELFKILANNPETLNLSNLLKEERIFLSFFYQKFVPEVTKSIHNTNLQKIQIKLFWRFMSWLDKYMPKIFKTIGLFFEFAYVKAQMGFNKIIKYTGDFKHEPLIEKYSSVDIDFNQKIDINFNLLIKLVNLCKKIGAKEIIFSFDRLDEDARLKSDMENLVYFVKTILSNDKILTSADFQILFSIWDLPYNEAKSSIRESKISFNNLNWRPEELKEALKNRLFLYSGGSIKSINDIFYNSVKETDVNSIFETAGNPRDLWHLFKHIIEQQNQINQAVHKIAKKAIKLALNKFVLEYNYYEHYPAKNKKLRKNSKGTYDFIGYLVQMNAPVFSATDLSTILKKNPQTASNTIKEMEKIGMCIRESASTSGNAAMYKILDPKILYMQKHKLKLNQ